MKKFILTSMMLGALLAQEGNEATDGVQEASTKSEVTDSQAKEESKGEAKEQKKEADKPQVLEAAEKSKSGFILGVEAGASAGKGTSYFISEELFQQKPFAMMAELEPFAPQAKFMLGYQKYFDAKERFGMDIKAKAGVGFLAISHDGETLKPNPIPFRDNDVTMITSYTTLHAGLEANFLFDFWSKDDQTLGMSFGVGYEFVYGLNSNIAFEHPVAHAIFSPRANAYANKNISYHVISPKIGLHYYLGNHQFSGVLGLEKALGDNQNINRVNGKVDILATKFDGFVSFNLGYAYRF